MRCSARAGPSSRRFPGRRATSSPRRSTWTAFGSSSSTPRACARRRMRSRSRACRARAAPGRPPISCSCVLDSAARLDADDLDLLDATAAVPRLVVANKADLPAAWDRADIDVPIVMVSSKTGEGLDTLRAAIRAALEGANPATARDTAAVTNVRHAELLARAQGGAAARRRSRGRAWWTGRGRVRAHGSAGRARRTRGSDRQTHVRGSAAAHLRAVLYWKVIAVTQAAGISLKNLRLASLR